MDSNDQLLVCVHFDEHPFLISNHKPINEHIIHFSSVFSHQVYSEELFRKILSIGLSEIPEFLNYHCSQVNHPIKWLNALDKLIKLNVERFSDKQADHRHFKFISQIDLKRHDLEISSFINLRNGHLRKTVNGFTEDREYSFTAVKEMILRLSTFDEKIEYLQIQIFEYRQDSPDFVSLKEKPFDTLCELEIQKLKTQEEIHQKTAKRNNPNQTNTIPVIKIKINCNLNYFCDIFYQLINEKKIKGRPGIEASPVQIALMLNQYFVDKDGNEISQASVLTFLDPNRPDKRPKIDKRFKLDDDP